MTKTNQTTTARRLGRLGPLALGTLLRLGGLVPVGAALCVGAASQPAQAQDYAAAGAHTSAAQDAFAAGKFELAAKEFQAAYDITRDPALLVSIGESWQRAGSGQKALSAYRAYLLAQPQAPDHAEIEGRVKSIETALVTPAPAGTAVPPGPGAPATGEQKPPAASAGTATPATPPEATPPEATRPEATKPEAAKAEATKPAEPLITPPEAPASRLRTAGWVMVASAVALATGGAIVGLGAQNRADELRRRTTLLVGGQPPIYDDSQREAYTSLMTEGRAYNDASIALLSLAGAAAVVGGSMLIADLARRPRVAARPPESKPTESKPAESKPVESKPAEGQPAESKPAESKPSDSKPTAQRPADALLKVTLVPAVSRGSAGLVLLGAF